MSEYVEKFLQSTSPEERVDALIRFYKRNTEVPNKDVLLYLEWAKRAASQDGWSEVAYAWFKETY